MAKIGYDRRAAGVFVVEEDGDLLAVPWAERQARVGRWVFRPEACWFGLGIEDRGGHAKRGWWISWPCCVLCGERQSVDEAVEAEEEKKIPPEFHRRRLLRPSGTVTVTPTMILHRVYR